jgi:hypothetical protein
MQELTISNLACRLDREITAIVTCTARPIMGTLYIDSHLEDIKRTRDTQLEVQEAFSGR